MGVAAECRDSYRAPMLRMESVVHMLYTARVALFASIPSLSTLIGRFRARVDYGLISTIFAGKVKHLFMKAINHYISE